MRTIILANFQNGDSWIQLVEYRNPLCTTGKDSCYVVHDRGTGEIPYRGRSAASANGVYFARLARYQ